MKKLIATTIILLLTLVILGYKWWQTGTPTTHNKVNKDIHQETKKKLLIHTKDNIAEKKITTNQPKPSQNTLNTDIAPISKNDRAQTLEPFEEIDIDTLKSHLPPLKDVEPLYAVKMKKNSITNSHIGDTILLPSIDGNSYEMLIKDKSLSATGNSTIYGEYSENGIIYHSVLTEGNNASFISMTTPTGSYEVNLMNAEGYIYASSDIENKKIDYKKSDTIIAPIKEERESLQ